jgi:hypothetical protein
MVILRLTRKLLSRVGLPTPVTTPSTTILGDWFGNLVFVSHQRYVLLVSERSRLPVIMPGRDLKNLARNFPAALSEVLQALGVPGAVMEAEVQASAEAVVAVTNSRSHLGTLNDFSQMLSYHLWGEPDADLVEVALWLGRTPVGPLGYDRPDRLTRRLLGLDAECAPERPLPLLRGGRTTREVGSPVVGLGLTTVMRVYYLDRPLSPEEFREASELLKVNLDQVQIPYVLPAPGRRGDHPDRPPIDEAAASPPLRAAGILKDAGQRVGLVIPGDMHWYAGFSHAIYTLTGYFPFLVQTAEHREKIGNPGHLRIVDMHGMMTG